MRIFAIFSLCLAALLQGCSTTADTATAQAAVEQFHHQLDAEQYADIYAGVGYEFTQVTSKDDFSKLLAAVHRKLGAYKAAKQTNWRVNFGGSGEVITLDYATDYAAGSAQEQFVFRMHDDKALLIGYHVNSNALITN